MNIQPQALPPGADGHRRDGRDLLAAIAMIDDGSLSAWGPSAAHIGNQKKPAFVKENQVGCDFQQIVAKAAIFWFNRPRPLYDLTWLRHCSWDCVGLHEPAEFISLPDAAELQQCIVDDRSEELPASGKTRTEHRPHTP